MKWIPFLSLLFLYISCSNDYETVGLIGKGKQISTIEHSLNNKNWVETFEYDDLGRVSKVINPFSFESTYEIQFDAQGVAEIHIFSKDGTVAHEKHTYDFTATGRLDEFVIWSTYPDGIFNKAWTHEFSYDNDGKLTEQKTFFNRTGEYVSTTRYEWKNGNIKKQSNFSIKDGEEILSYTVDMKYDNKFNYLMSHPLKLQNPVRLNKNNLVKSEFEDFIGTLDLSCFICEVEYKYDNECPVEIDLEGENSLKIEYR